MLCYCKPTGNQDMWVDMSNFAPDKSLAAFEYDAKCLRRSSQPRTSHFGNSLTKEAWGRARPRKPELSCLSFDLFCLYSLRISVFIGQCVDNSQGETFASASRGNFRWSVRWILHLGVFVYRGISFWIPGKPYWPTDKDKVGGGVEGGQFPIPPSFPAEDNETSQISEAVMRRSCDL